MLECLSCRKVFLHAAKKSRYIAPEHISSEPYTSTTVEASVCPYCESIGILEVTEKIASLKSVDINEVDDWLAKGYCVHETFSKQATIKLLEKKP